MPGGAILYLDRFVLRTQPGVLAWTPAKRSSVRFRFFSFRGGALCLALPRTLFARLYAVVPAVARIEPVAPRQCLV